MRQSWVQTYRPTMDSLFTRLRNTLISHLESRRSHSVSRMLETFALTSPFENTRTIESFFSLRIEFAPALFQTVISGAQIYDFGK